MDGLPTIPFWAIWSLSIPRVESFSNISPNARHLSTQYESFASHSPAELRSYANRLIGRGFLVPTGSDERSLVDENERVRRDRLRSGYLVRALQLVTINSCNYACKYCFMNLQEEDRSDSRSIAVGRTDGIRCG